MQGPRAARRGVIELNCHLSAPTSAMEGADFVLELLSSLIPRDEERIEKCFAVVDDWETLLTYAERHGVLGLLDSALPLKSHCLPSEILREIQRRAIVQRLIQTDLHRSLDEIFAA